MFSRSSTRRGGARARLCDALDAASPGRWRCAALGRRRRWPITPRRRPPRDDGVLRRTRFHERRTMQVADLQAETAEYPVSSVARQRGFRRSSTPLLRGRAIGAISIRRTEVRPFTDRANRASADLRRPGRDRHRERPAVHELQTSNRELTEALEQQTATGEILRVIASSPTDAAAGARRDCRECGRCASAAGTSLLLRGRRAASTRRRRGRGPPLAPARLHPWQPVLPRERVGPGGRRARTFCTSGTPSSRRGETVWPDAPTASGRRTVACGAAAREGTPIGVDRGLRARRSGRSPTSRSRSVRPSPTRPSSRSRTCGCSRVAGRTR